VCKRGSQAVKAVSWPFSLMAGAVSSYGGLPIVSRSSLATAAAAKREVGHVVAERPAHIHAHREARVIL
jgi:hypothetical protein